MKLRPEFVERINKLEEKYASIGQDMNSYLDGLLYSNVTTYWDYVNVDTLLSLQHPKTDYPDELIFIMYHQVTELYFRLALHELEQIANNGRDIVMETGEDKGWKKTIDPNYFATRVNRINNYFEALTLSFDIMGNGMEKQQFLRFRMALLPASGFQSAQYRMIEICATDFIRLVDKDDRKKFEGKKASIEKMFEHIYWKKGATEIATGEKTLTLKHFEKKYSSKLIALAKDYKEKNLWTKYKSLSKAEQKNTALINALKQLDVNVNVNWPLVHYRSAAKYLEKGKNEDVAATGGTNWQKYLPPRFQKRMFYPELWSEQEKENWGKSWVESIIKNK
jgi:tryptophan 2,3-dioxygenase